MYGPLIIVLGIFFSATVTVVLIQKIHTALLSMCIWFDSKYCLPSLSSPDPRRLLKLMNNLYVPEPLAICVRLRLDNAARP
jgi:hypothetical protein